MLNTGKYDSLLVFCESTGSGALETVSLEVLSLAGELSQAAGYHLFVAADQDIPDEAAACDADKIYMARTPFGNGYRPEAYVALLEQACRQCKPEAVIFAHTPLAQDIVPRLALRLGTRFISGAVGLTIENNQILVQKQIRGGLALATYSFNTHPHIITVRRGVGAISKPDNSRRAERQQIEVPWQQEDSQWKIIERVREESPEIKLEEAEVIVSGGRGMGGKKGFELLKQLATALGAAVGASRPPCDAGWISSSHQIGITGAVVNPGLYLAVAISGTRQHLSGMADSKKIVAINTDPDANIFKVSDYGLVCDYRQALPTFIDIIKTVKEKRA